MWWRWLPEVQTEHQNGEERGFKWLWTWNGCWCISKTADLLGFSRTSFTENGQKKRKYPVIGSCVDERNLVGVRGQRRMVRLVRDDRMATVTQITTRYNKDMQNTKVVTVLDSFLPQWSCKKYCGLAVNMFFDIFWVNCFSISAEFIRNYVTVFVIVCNTFFLQLIIKRITTWASCRNKSSSTWPMLSSGELC